MIYLKTLYEIQQIEHANKLGAELLQQCYEYIKSGIATIELEQMAEKFCFDNNVLPSFKGYQGFPFCLCVSVNEEVVHGIPSERIVKEGDIVSVDFGVNRNGYFSDQAFTKCVEKVLRKAKKIVKTTEECLYEGIKKARPGNRINDISRAIQSHAER
jgi:methionyl aminopeptidase